MKRLGNIKLTLEMLNFVYQGITYSFSQLYSSL